MPISISARALLSACAKAIAPRLLRLGRRLHAQRQAASGEVLPTTDRIVVCLDETIAALTGRANKLSWWPNAIAKMQQAGINPDPIFRGASLSSWLDDLQVRQSLRALASRRLHDGSDEPGSLIGAVPADCLPQIGRDKGSDYSEQRCQNKSGRLVVSGVTNFAVTPAINPMMIVQMMCMGTSLLWPEAETTTPRFGFLAVLGAASRVERDRSRFKAQGPDRNWTSCSGWSHCVSS
jgi:hypothetical protein